MYNDFYRDITQQAVGGGVSTFDQVWVWVSFSLLVVGVVALAVLALYKFIPAIKQMVGQYLGESKMLNHVVFLINSLVILQSANVIIRRIPSIGQYVDFLNGLLSHAITLLVYSIWLTALGIGIILITKLSKSSE